MVLSIYATLQQVLAVTTGSAIGALMGTWARPLTEPNKNNKNNQHCL